MPERDPEFYVGYAARAPPGVASRIRLAIGLLIAVAVALAILLVNGQHRFARSVFEFGIPTELTGIVGEQPLPHLRVERPGDVGDDASFSIYPLVAVGKRGAAELIADLDGRPVTLRGSLIYRDDKTMVEVEKGTIRPLSGEAAERLLARIPPVREVIGERTIRGEIIDTKCYLGVMKPGSGKPHRSCAIRCIRGGVPPALVVTDTEGRADYYFLVDREGKAVNHRVLDRVGEAVEITGRVVRYGDLQVLEADL